MKKMIFILFLLLCAHPAFAVTPDEMLKDPVLEARARNISAEVRCLVCQGESIDDSNADLAADLRKLVRQRLKAGDSDDQVLAYLRARYGDYVLLKPPVEQSTLILWLAPLLALLGGCICAVFVIRRGKGAA